MANSSRVSNADIFREVNQVKRDNSDMLNMIKDHEARIRPLENWKIAYEAAVKALDGVSTPRPTNAINKEFVNIVTKFIALLTGMVGVIYLAISNLK